MACSRRCLCEWGRCGWWRTEGTMIPIWSGVTRSHDPVTRLIYILIPAPCCCHSNRLADRGSFGHFREFICRIFITLIIISVIFINARLSQAYMMSFISIYWSETQTQPRPAGRSQIRSDLVEMIILNRRLSDNPSELLNTVSDWHCLWPVTQRSVLLKYPGKDDNTMPQLSWRSIHFTLWFEFIYLFVYLLSFSFLDISI